MTKQHFYIKNGRPQRQAGYTLVELSITVSIIAVLLAVVVAVSVGVALKRGKMTGQLAAIPVVGTVGLALVSFKLDTMTDWRLSIFGLITLFVVYYLQDGIVGFVRQALNLKARTERDATASAC